jgi:beta-glucanase (GH16 family)
MLHPGNLGGPQSLPFNPSEDFHRYGFLFTPQRVQWTADGKVIQTLENVALGGDGILMMNAWTGNPNWGGGPPAQDVHAVYDWVKYWPGATGIPADASPVRAVSQPPMRASRSRLAFPVSPARAEYADRLGTVAIMREGAGRGYYGLSGRWLRLSAPTLETAEIPAANP